MIESVSIPKSSDEVALSSQAKGFIYFPASNLTSLHIALFDRRYGLPLTVKTPVVSRPQEAQPR